MTQNFTPDPTFVEKLKERYQLTDEEFRKHAVIIDGNDPGNAMTARVIKLPAQEQLDILLKGVAELAKKYNLTVAEQNAISIMAIEEYNKPTEGLTPAMIGEKMDEAAKRIRNAVQRMRAAPPKIISSGRTRADRRKRNGRPEPTAGSTTKDRRKKLAAAVKSGKVKLGPK